MDEGYCATDSSLNEFEYEIAYWTWDFIWIYEDSVSLLINTCSYSGNHDYTEPEKYDNLSFDEAIFYI